jgi:hypothetical protein
MQEKSFFDATKILRSPDLYQLNLHPDPAENHEIERVRYRSLELLPRVTQANQGARSPPELVSLPTRKNPIKGEMPPVLRQRRQTVIFQTNGTHKRVNPYHYAHRKSHPNDGRFLQTELTFPLDPLFSALGRCHQCATKLCSYLAKLMDQFSSSVAVSSG